MHHQPKYGGEQREEVERRLEEESKIHSRITKNSIAGLVRGAALGTLIGVMAITVRKLRFPTKLMFVTMSSLGVGNFMAERSVVDMMRQPYLHATAATTATTTVEDSDTASNITLMAQKGYSTYMKRNTVIFSSMIAGAVGSYCLVQKRLGKLSNVQKFANIRLASSIIGLSTMLAMSAYGTFKDRNDDDDDSSSGGASGVVYSGTGSSDE